MNDPSLFPLLEKGLQEARSLGVNEALLSALVTERRGVEVFERQLQAVQVADEMILSVWLKSGERWGASACEGVSEQALKQAISQAKVAADFSDPDPDYVLVRGAQEVVQEKVEEALVGLSMKELEHQALAMEAAAYQSSPKIKNVSELSLGHLKRTRYLLNSAGLKNCESYALLQTSLSVLAEGEDKRVVSSEDGQSFRRQQDFDPDAWVSEVSQEAIRRLNPQAPKSGTWPVVLDKACAVQILQSFAVAFSGDFLYKGLSKLEKKLGQLIASNTVSLFQSPSRGLVPVALDGEGSPAQELYLIKDGVFQTFYHNLYTAKKSKTKSTGNAALSPGQAPALSPLNLSWEGKMLSQTELLQAMHEGLYIKELHGAMASPISGDFSYGALGYWVEQGKIQYPVADFTVAGNFFELLLKIQAMGEKLRYDSAHTTGSYGGRELWVDGLSISA